MPPKSVKTLGSAAKTRTSCPVVVLHFVALESCLRLLQGDGHGGHGGGHEEGDLQSHCAVATVAASLNDKLLQADSCELQSAWDVFFFAKKAASAA